MSEKLAPDIEAIVLACLAKDPAERPLDGSALAEVLAKTTTASTWSDDPSTPSAEALAALTSGPSPGVATPQSEDATRRIDKAG